MQSQREFRDADAPDVPHEDVATAICDIWNEWDLVEQHGDEALATAERIAYTEGLQRALEILTRETGITPRGERTTSRASKQSIPCGECGGLMRGGAGGIYTCLSCPNEVQKPEVMKRGR